MSRFWVAGLQFQEKRQNARPEGCGLRFNHMRRPPKTDQLGRQFDPINLEALSDRQRHLPSDLNR